MADAKISALTDLAAVPAADDYYAIVDTSAGSTKKVAHNKAQGTKYLAGLIPAPQVFYASRPEIFIFETPAAITISRINIQCNTSSPTTDVDLDLKFADDMFTGSFANATVIDACDTTNGFFTVSASTDMDDPTVPANKYMYLSLDASPDATVKDFFIRIDYTMD
jgi:hypothetical protein